MKGDASHSNSGMTGFGWPGAKVAVILCSDLIGIKNKDRYADKGLR
jgi:hypothetical protein